MTPEEEAENVIRKGRKAVKRYLIKCIKRIEYLEGEEFYNSIIESLQKNTGK